MTASLSGYAMLKALGKGSGPDALRQNMAARFLRTVGANKGVEARDPVA